MKYTKTTTYFVLWSLWIFAAISAILILISFFIVIPVISDIIESKSQIIAAIFILLSASIASASMMRSIEANKELKEYELFLTKKSNLLFIRHIYKDTNGYMPLLNNNDSFSTLRRTFGQIKTTWYEIYKPDFFSILSNDNMYTKYKKIDDNIYIITSITNTNDIKKDVAVKAIESVKKDIKVSIKLLDEEIQKLEKRYKEK